MSLIECLLRNKSEWIVERDNTMKNEMEEHVFVTYHWQLSSSSQQNLFFLTMVPPEAT